MTSERPRPGDWVTVLGQVLDEPTHPDDLVVEFFSHGEQWSGHVKRDRIEIAAVPNFALPCTSLWQRDDGSLLRCCGHWNHFEAHANGGQLWNDEGEYGHVEEVS